MNRTLADYAVGSVWTTVGSWHLYNPHGDLVANLSTGTTVTVIRVHSMTDRCEEHKQCDCLGWIEVLDCRGRTGLLVQTVHMRGIPTLSPGGFGLRWPGPMGKPRYLQPMVTP
jgi:hypothetical protein